MAGTPNMKAGDKVVLDMKNPENEMTNLEDGILPTFEYTISELVGDKLRLSGFDTILFPVSRFTPREEFTNYHLGFSDYHLFVTLMKDYLNNVPAGFLREEAARNIKKFWDFVDIGYQRNLPRGSSLRTRSDKELGLE